MFSNPRAPTTDEPMFTVDVELATPPVAMFTVLVPNAPVAPVAIPTICEPVD